MKNTSKITKILVRAATAGCIFCALNVMAATDDKKIISSTPVPAVKAPTVSAPVQAVKRKATIKVPVKPVVPKPRVPAPTQTTRPANPRPGDITRPTGPTRTVTPKVNIKTPVRTRPIQESAVKVLPPPNPPTRPQMQPRVNLKRPLGQVPPMSAGNYPPPWPPLNKPAQQSGFSVKRPENFAPRNLPHSQKGQILDPRYAPPLPAPSRIGSGRGRGRGNDYGYGYGDGYGAPDYGRTAYDPVAPRIPGNTAIRNPNFNDPRFQKIGRNRELFERMEDMERMKALQAGQEGLKAPWNRDAPDPAAGSPFEGYGPGNMNDYGANNMNERKAAGGDYLHAPGMSGGGSGNYMQAPPRAGAVLDTSRQGWVSDVSTETTSGPGWTNEVTTETDDDGNIVSRTSKMTEKSVDGTETIETTHTVDTSGYSNTSMIIRSNSTGEITFFSHPMIGRGTNEMDVGSSSTTYTRGRGSSTYSMTVGHPRVIGGDSQSENTGDKKYGNCIQGAGGCAKKTRTKPMDTVTLPSKGDADTDPGSSPIIGAAAVTNEDEFHSLSAGSGGGGGGDVLTQPPTEGAEGGGSTPPPPTPGGG